MEYQKCLVELDEILEHLREEEQKKIPYEIRNIIKREKDKKYKWNYDETKSLREQNINRKTIAMLSYLNLEYLLSKEQKVVLSEIHKLNEIKTEEEKKKKYNTKDLFKNKTTKKEEMVSIIVETKDKKWTNKVITFLKQITKKK